MLINIFLSRDIEKLHCVIKKGFSIGEKGVSLSILNKTQYEV